MTIKEFNRKLSGRPLTAPPNLSVHAEKVVARLRTQCTVCGTKVNSWSELEPGSGRCERCMP